MWTPTTRRQHSRAGLRYETDLTDAEWAVDRAAAAGAGAMWPAAALWRMREILNGIFYVLRGGIAWRLLPKDLPPKSTVFGYFSRWRDAGVFRRINHHLVMADRERVGREASPVAAVLDSQSVKTTESGGPRGYDAGKKVKGRKRQVMVDTDGRALVLEPQPANVQDRDGAVPVLQLFAPGLPVRHQGLCRCRLCRRQTRDRHHHHGRDRPQTTRSGRLCRSSAPLGGRTLLRLDQPQPQALEGPRGNPRLRQSLPLRRVRHDPGRADWPDQ